MSSDFGNHPLSHLMGSVFGMHNRKNVEVYNFYNLCVSNGMLSCSLFLVRVLFAGVLLCIKFK